MRNVALELIYKIHPETKNTKTATRSQILSILNLSDDYKKHWFLEPKNTITRGIYALPGYVKPTLSLEPMLTLSDVEFKQTAIDMAVMPTKLEIVTHLHPVNIEHQSPNLIPKIDPNYVPFGIHKDVEQIIKSNMFYPVYVYGESGNGKSTTIEQVCAKLKRPIIRINLNNHIDEDQLIGSKTLIDGNVEIVEGPVVKALRNGWIIVFEELDAANANSILAIQGIMEGKDFYFKLKHEIITPAPGFNIFATGNTKGKGSEDGRYIGTQVLNESFLERFAITMVQEFPKSNVELKIIQNIMLENGCVDDEYATDLVRWANAIRICFNDGIMDENITTRRLIHIVKAYGIFKNKKKSIELCVNRFDEVTRLAFIDLFDKIQNDQTEELTPNAL